MSQNLNAEVISIGTEILLGELTDTNSVYIARVLRDLGINLYFMTSVGDNEGRIAQAIQTALSRAQVVITCGGLGPTVDDMTRQAVALATNRALQFHQDLLDQIAARFAGFQVAMTENNRRQAYLPDNAVVIENAVGTAPAFIVEHAQGLVISLPGVPREMKFLMVEKVIPYLRQRYDLGIIKAKTLKTAGVGESALDEMIGQDLLNASNPSIGLAAHSGQVDVRITAKANTLEEVDLMIAEMEVKLRERIGQFIYGADDEQLEGVLVNFLKAHHGTLAVVEAGIDSLSKAMQGQDASIIQVQSFLNPSALRESLSLSNGATLREIAINAAENAAVVAGAMAGIAIVSNPDIEEASDTTEGTAVAVFTSAKSRNRAYGFGGKSEMARNWVSMWAMSVTWQMLQEQARGT
ncbi:MAG: competence/damage-inducible protein A [Chitinophagaceae bacterium]|nr:competence/damage-inducible protein A [Anaerolineae bacterium]